MIKEDAKIKLLHKRPSQEFDDRSAEECADGESDEEEGDEEGGGQLLDIVWFIP